MRILVIEDDLRIAEPVAAALRRRNYAVDVAVDGLDGRELSSTDLYDVVLLDVMLPRMGGLDICRSLRRDRSTAKILMMTARDGVDDKVTALDSGADDYLVKPFELAELLARVRALTRRDLSDRNPLLRHERFELDPSALCASYDGHALDLTRIEYAVLEAFLRNPKRVFSAELLYEKVTDFDASGSSRSIKTHVGNLRRKIREAGCGFDPILTVYGLGYRLADLP